MAIDAFGMSRRIQSAFGRIVDSFCVEDGMNAHLVEFTLDVFGGHVAAMAGVAVLLFGREGKQPRLCAGPVRSVAILAGVAGDRFEFSMGPRIDACAIPCFW